MADKRKKKAISIYIYEDELEAYKEACKANSRNMASQGEALIRKFILNHTRHSRKES